MPVLTNIVWNRVNADCTHLDLVHKTPVDEVPTAIASFQGRILVGIGRMLRLYDMGRKKLLRKCENKVSEMNVVTSLVVKVKLYLFLCYALCWGSRSAVCTSWLHACVGGAEVLSVCTSWLHACVGGVEVLSVCTSWLHACVGGVEMLSVCASWLHACVGGVEMLSVCTSWLHACVGGVEMLSVCTSWLHALAAFHSRQLLLLLLHFDGLGWLQRSRSGYGDSSRLVTLLNLLTPNDPYIGRTAPLTSNVAFYIFIQQI